MAEPGPMVVGDDQTSVGAVDVERLVDVARRTLAGEGVTGGRLDVIFVDEDVMAELNAAHMGHDGPTDVLAFPLDTDLPADDGESGDPAEPVPVHLGDVVICPAVAGRQAPDHCGTEEAELALLVIHGVLHVLGHDHAEADETLVMQARERHHLAALGFGHPEPV